MSSTEVVSKEEYLKARVALLEKEKAATRLLDSLARERRALPLVEVTKDYTFVDADTQKPVTLTELFQGRKQLIVYHAMFDPSWDQGCQNCTLLLDHIPPLDHLHSHNTSLAVISLAPADKIATYKTKMNLTRFPWLSSYQTTFNTDYNVTMTSPTENNNNSDTALGTNDTYNFQPASYYISKNQTFMTQGEQPGHSIFVRGGPKESGGVGKGEIGKIYHSYSAYSKAGEAMINTVQWLDWTVLGRQDRHADGDGGVDYRRRGEYDI